MKNLLFIPLLFLATGLLAQTIILGKVTDDKGVPLLGANIYIEDTYDGTSSDLDGSFSFKSSESGTRILKVESVGYRAYQQEIQLAGEALEFQLSLKEEFNELNAVVITAGSFEAGDKKRAIALTAMDVATTSGAMGDIIGAINTLPGTTSVGESGRLYVRGGSDQETKTFIDGLLVSQPYHASGPNLATRGRFNPFLFNGVIFNTGGYSAEYGQALSSVLLLNTLDEKQKDELNLSFLLGLGADFAGTKSWDGGSVTASANYFNMGLYTKLTSMNQDWKKPAELYSQEISLKQRTGKHGMFKMYSNINQSQFSLLQNDLDKPGEKFEYGQTNTNYFLNTSWKNPLSEKLMFYSGISFTRNKDEINLDENPLSEKLYASHLKAGLDYQVNDKINIRFGSDYFYNYYSFAHVTDSLKTDTGFHNNLAAGYLEASIYTSTRFVFRLGGRMEYSPLLNKFNYAPRFSTAFKIDDASQLSFAYGMFYQTPSNQDLIWQRSLDFQRADHFVLNYQKSINERIFRVETFYKDYLQLVRFGETGNSDGRNYTNDGYGYAYGAELFLRDNKSIKNGQFWLSYSYLQTERLFKHYPAQATPDFASKHNFSLVYKHFISSWRSMVSANFSYASPRVYNDPNKEDFNKEKMPSLQSLNMSWAYLFRPQIIFYGAINNVLGREQHFGYRFSNNLNSEGFFNSEPIVPFSKRFYVVGLFFTFSKDKTKNQLDKIN